MLLLEDRPALEGQMASNIGWQRFIGSPARMVVARSVAADALQPATILRLALLAMLVIPVAPLAAEEQLPKQIPRLCFLTFDPDAARSTRWGAFFEGLHDLGYVDGQTIIIDYLSANGYGEQFPELAAECLRLNVDIIVASTTPAAQVAKNATRTSPIVMLGLGDPVGAGLVDDLARPGRNVTGNTLIVSELTAKRLSLLKEAVPSISRVLVLSYLTDPIAPLQVEALKAVAPSLGVTLQIQDIRTADDIPAAFEAGVREHADGLLTTAESIFHVQRALVGALAIRYRLPSISPFASLATDAGGLMAYDLDLSDVQRRAAVYVDRILKGTKPADLPVERPTKFEFVINLGTAKALGLTIPSSILDTADMVVQ
jgi:putative ABC transport system substrate-binding protein